MPGEDPTGTSVGVDNDVRGDVSTGGMYWLADGSVISRTHARDECMGQVGCPLHAPSDHPLRDAPLVSYPATGGLGRRCAHQDLPDVDDVAWRGRGATTYVGRRPDWLHRPCCGCCGLDQSAWFDERATYE